MLGLRVPRFYRVNSSCYTLFEREKYALFSMHFVVFHTSSIHYNRFKWNGAGHTQCCISHGCLILSQVPWLVCLHQSGLAWPITAHLSPHPCCLPRTSLEAWLLLVCTKFGRALSIPRCCLQIKQIKIPLAGLLTTRNLNISQSLS